MVWNIIWAFCFRFLKHSDVFIYQTSVLYNVLAIYVCHVCRKKVFQLLSVGHCLALSYFHSCFLKGTSLLCKCHPSYVVWMSKPGSTTHIFRPIYAEFGNFILSWLLNALNRRQYCDAFIVMTVRKHVKWSIEYNRENFLWFTVEWSDLKMHSEVHWQ